MSPPIRTAVVLAGGAGLRLRPLMDDLPKVMIKVAGKPLLEWIINWLKRNSVTDIVLGVAYRKECIFDYFGDGKNFGVKISYSEHTVEGGTGEGFRLTIERCVKDQTFLATNGDELTNIRLSEFADFHRRSGGLATIAVSMLRSSFGVVEINGDTITGFHEKPVLNPYRVSTGVYIFNHGILDYLPRRGSIEKETFPKLASLSLLKAYAHEGFWGTINTVKDLHEVERQLLKHGA